MTTNEALAVLNQATQPQVAGKITREGYAQIDLALTVVGSACKERDTLALANAQLRAAQAPMDAADAAADCRR